MTEPHTPLCPERTGTEGQMWQDLRDMPHSDNLRLVLADFLEERVGPSLSLPSGHVPSDADLAYALRWAVARHKRPLKTALGWEWHLVRRHFDESEDLPHLVLQATPALTAYIASGLPEAYQALARALRTLKALWSLNP